MFVNQINVFPFRMKDSQSSFKLQLPQALTPSKPPTGLTPAEKQSQTLQYFHSHRKAVLELSLFYCMYNYAIMF